jgi:ABC-type bacteriocin/lantibiotic exporter with double-glycine peptidase domain
MLASMCLNTLMPLVFGAATPDPSFLGNFVLAAIAIAGVVVAIMSARRTPPLAEEIRKEFATKDQIAELRKETVKAMAELRTETAATVRRIHERIEAMVNQMHRNHADSEQARGRLFGQMEGISRAIEDVKEDLRGMKG